MRAKVGGSCKESEMNLLYAQTGLQLFERYLFSSPGRGTTQQQIGEPSSLQRQKRETARRICPERKSSGVRAFMIQCVELPRLWPFARTRVGKTSLR